MEYWKRKQGGFSLLEVMVAAGLMGLLAYGTMALFSHFARASGKISGSLRWDTGLASVKSVLGTERCHMAISNATIDASIPQEGAGQSGIVSTVDSIRLGTSALMARGDRFGDFRLTSMSLVRLGDPVGIRSSGTDRWRWQMRLDVVAKYGDRRKERSFPISVITPTNLHPGFPILPIEGCSLSAVQSAQEVCALLGGIWNEAGQRCAMSVEARNSDPPSPVIGQMWIRTDL